MPRLPAITRLADEIRGTTRGKQTVKGAVDFLVSRRSELQRFAGPDDLGEAAYGDQPSPAAKALAVNFDLVRNAIVEELWQREIFIGTSVMDDLLFFAAREPSVQDPLLETLQFLRDRRATRPGFVLFPLHSLGILRAGLLRGDTKQEAQYIHPEWGLALTPQTNSLDQTIDFLGRVREGFGIHKPVDPELVRHWYRSRAKWLERNPMLAIRMTTQRGSYYDTEALVLSRVRAATAQLAMVSTFQSSTVDRPSALFSSSRINNWETLDIHHYIVFADNPGRSGTLNGDCVPIHHGRGVGIVELSDLSIEIDPAYRGSRKTIASIDAAIGSVYRGHLEHMWPRRRDARTRTNARLFEALSFFLRSFHLGGASWSATVSLATAYEMLLTDSYSRGVSERLRRRLALVLRGVPGTRAYQAAFAGLYRARGNLVHAGSEAGEVDLKAAQQAFVHAFCALAPRVDELARRTESPMRDLTGDVPTR